MRFFAFPAPAPAQVLLAALVLTPAAAGAVTINFDTYPGGGLVPPGFTIADQWKSLGVVFSDAAGDTVGASNNNCSLSAPNHAYAPTIVARFVDPTTGSPALTAYVGTAQDHCWVGGEGIAIRAYNLSGDLIGSVFNPSAGSGDGHFESLSFPSAVVARVEMDCIGQGIDDFVFDAPTVVGVGDVGDEPGLFALRNLVNPSVGGRLTMAFSLAGYKAAQLELTDVTGRRVTAREVGSLGPGPHQVVLGSGLASGVYFVRLREGARTAVERVAVVH